MIESLFSLCVQKVLNRMSVVTAPVSMKYINQLRSQLPSKDEADPSGGDEVVPGPVAGPNEPLLVRHHVLVVVHPRVGDLQM